MGSQLEFFEDNAREEVEEHVEGHHVATDRIGADLSCQLLTYSVGCCLIQSVAAG